MHIIHLSDTHFGNSEPAFDLQKLKNALNELSYLFGKPDTYLVVSGDITYKGNIAGYTQAQNFFNDTWLSHNGAKDRFLACPGNHDICDTGFNRFDAFLYSIRRNHQIDFSKRPAFIVGFENVIFLLINSAYYLDRKYGCVDFEYLDNYLKENIDILSNAQHRIAVVHHHLIGTQKIDTSTIRNSLPFITLLDEHKFNLILHGHQHSQAYLSVGKNNIEIISARSLNYQSSGLVNGINIISYENGIWKRQSMVLSEDNTIISALSFSRTE
jgi:3',5'-cyclic AMP phosphodiesterase CpdA